MEIADNQFEVVTTIVKRVHYDPTNSTLYPVAGEDLKIEAQPPTEDGKVRVATVYLKIAVYS